MTTTTEAAASATMFMIHNNVDKAYNEEVNNDDNIDGTFRHNQQSNWSLGVGGGAQKTECNNQIVRMILAERMG